MNKNQIKQALENLGSLIDCEECQRDYDVLKKYINTEFTRVEVIEPVGRVYTTHNKKVELSIQDEGRTLKIFIE